MNMMLKWNVTMYHLVALWSISNHCFGWFEFCCNVGFLCYRGMIDTCVFSGDRLLFFRKIALSRFATFKTFQTYQTNNEKFFLIFYARQTDQIIDQTPLPSPPPPPHPKIRDEAPQEDQKTPFFPSLKWGKGLQTIILSKT